MEDVGVAVSGSSEEAARLGSSSVDEEEAGVGRECSAEDGYGSIQSRGRRPPRLDGLWCRTAMRAVAAVTAYNETQEAPPGWEDVDVKGKEDMPRQRTEQRAL